MSARLLLILAVLMSASSAEATLTLQNCAETYGDTARCGWLEVPEDRAAPDGRRIRIQVVVLPNKGAGDADSAPLVLFPGGPGQATPTLIPVAEQLYPAVRQTRDVVFVGQRGSGRSHPMDCLEEVASDPTLLFGALWNREGIRQCYAATRELANPEHYTTADYVADVIQVLDELGYGKVVLWGGSGGTRIAQAFLREAPDRVLAAVLDGTTPIDYAMPLPFSRYAQRAWDRVVADCEAQPGCAEAFPDLDADLRQIFERVASSPQPTQITLPDDSTATVRVSSGDLAYALRGLLYNPGAIRRLPAMVHRAATAGDLSTLAQSLYDRSVGLLTGGVIAVGLHITQYCAEDVPRIDDERVAKETEGTFLGDYLVREYRGACKQWPVPAAPDSWYRDFESQVPTLFLSGYYDPSTPEVVAEQVRRSLPNSRHLVVRDASHGAGFTCARPVVEEFLRTAALEVVGDPCPEVPIVFETVLEEK